MTESLLPRMYRDLTWTFPIITPPEDYVREAGEFVQAIRKHSLVEARTLLDLGCGAGHNDYTLQKSFKVTGIDLSPEMLGLARQLNPGVEYLLGDMRSVRLDRSFDAVMAADAIGYMLDEAELLAAFTTAFFHLSPGGVFATYAEETAGRFRQNGTYVSTHRQGEIEIALVDNHYDPDPTDTTFEDTFVYLIRRQGVQTVEVDRHILGLFPEETWLRLLREAGFEVRQEVFEEAESPFFIGLKPLS